MLVHILRTPVEIRAPSSNFVRKTNQSPLGPNSGGELDIESYTAYHTRYIYILAQSAKEPADHRHSFRYLDRAPTQENGTQKAKNPCQNNPVYESFKPRETNAVARRLPWHRGSSASPPSRRPKEARRPHPGHRATPCPCPRPPSTPLLPFPPHQQQHS